MLKAHAHIHKLYNLTLHYYAYMYIVHMYTIHTYVHIHMHTYKQFILILYIKCILENERPFSK